MKVIKNASEEEMVSAFVSAEIESPRFGPAYLRALAHLGIHLPPHSVGPFLARPDHHRLRAWLLNQCRGYGRDHFLFRGFPQHVSWRWCECRASDLGEWRYPRFPDWVALTGGSLRVSDGAEAIAKRPDRPEAAHVKSILQRVAMGWTPPPLIVVRTSAGDHVLLEGCMRASAMAMGAPQAQQRVLLGVSPNVDQWVHR